MQTSTLPEPVNVIATFRHNSLGEALALPQLMHWRGRRHHINAVTEHLGPDSSSPVKHRFRIEVGAATYTLEFDATSLSWQLYEA